MLTQSQIDVLDQAQRSKAILSIEQISKIATALKAADLSDDELLDFLEISNHFYRNGEPLISDHQYDAIFLAELAKRNPQHDFLHSVEPELLFAGKTVALPEKMLSTEKAYTEDSIIKWLARIEKAAKEIDLDFQQLNFRATPKLDGYAAYDDGTSLFTRGDGRKGTDITRVFDRGLAVGGNGERGQGAGEIVVSQQYFNTYLAEFFENARNFQASIIKEKELEQHAQTAIEGKAAVFFPFAQLPDWNGSAEELTTNFMTIVDQVLGLVDYDVDGVVFEVTDPALKQIMGATRHHHRWQIAFKSNVEKAEVKVLDVTPQTSRSGRVNPVVELEPTKLSGALISRATAHHYGLVKTQGIGVGTIIELTRSGLVIPKIERVLLAKTPLIPEHCPSCGAGLSWDSDYLFCLNNNHCPAQIEHTIEHFFKTLGNVDGFGQKTIEKLHKQGVDSVIAIYQLTFEQLQSFGFGDKTSQNLLSQLLRSRTEAIEDWRFLGAFGIHRMGLGNCERLLQHHSLETIFDLNEDDIVDIEGFAEKTAEAIVSSLKLIREDLNHLYQLGFNLTRTKLVSEQPIQSSPIAGKTLVFTGTMIHGKRDDMKKQAKQLGAKVAASVTGKTDYLITGEKVGANKIKAAEQKGVKVVSEQDYLKMLGITLAEKVET